MIDDKIDRLRKEMKEGFLEITKKVQGVEQTGKEHHAQNRSDIHRINGEMQVVSDNFVILLGSKGFDGQIQTLTKSVNTLTGSNEAVASEVEGIKQVMMEVKGAIKWGRNIILILGAILTLWVSALEIRHKLFQDSFLEQQTGIFNAKQLAYSTSKGLLK